MNSNATTAATTNNNNTNISIINSSSSSSSNHPTLGPPTIREYDHILLHFADNRQIFAQAVPKHKRPGIGASGGGGIGGGVGGAAPHHPCKINKRSYATHNLIGLPYGTVLEVGRDGKLIPLADGEDLLPKSDIFLMNNNGSNNYPEEEKNEEEENDDDGDDAMPTSNDNDINGGTATTTTASTNTTTTHSDNRNLIDDNTSQRLTHTHVDQLKSSSTSGSHIVAALISNSATFSSKTKYSQAKYVTRKQMKYQIRCRIVQVTPFTMCAAMHSKDARKMANLRDDTLGRILSNANVHAGQYVLVADDAVQGIISASCVKRMGGYGTVMGLYPGKFVPGYVDVTAGRMNYSLRERQMLRWISLGEVFGNTSNSTSSNETNNTATTSTSTTDSSNIVDIEKRDREKISWPAPLQSHTRTYITNDLKTEHKINVFLEKRSARFTRKLTRYSLLELRELIGNCRNEKEVYSMNGNVNEGGDGGGGGGGRVGMAVDKEEKGVEESTDRMDHDGPPREDDKRQCDSLIIATKYDPTATLFGLLPYLAPSCPFVVYSEFLEPLLHTFHALQNYYVPQEELGDVDGNHAESINAVDDTNNNNTIPDAVGTKKPPPMMQRRNIAINLRLTDSWFREYQVLEGRTHPNMSMSQNGGYILAGTMLCPLTGTNELDDNVMKAMRAKFGGRRRQQSGNTTKRGGGVRPAKRKKVEK